MMTKNNKFLFVFRLKLPVSPLITVARTSLWNPCNVTSKGKLVVQCRPSMMSWKIYTPFLLWSIYIPFLLPIDQDVKDGPSCIYLRATSWNFVKMSLARHSFTRFLKTINTQYRSIQPSFTSAKWNMAEIFCLKFHLAL